MTYFIVNIVQLCLIERVVTTIVISTKAPAGCGAEKSRSYHCRAYCADFSTSSK